MNSQLVVEQNLKSNLQMNGHTVTNVKKTTLSSSNGHSISHAGLVDEEQLVNAYSSIIDAIGEDTKRQGLVKTPDRAAKAFIHFTKGYKENVKGIISDHNLSLKILFLISRLNSKMLLKREFLTKMLTIW